MTFKTIRLLCKKAQTRGTLTHFHRSGKTWSAKKEKRYRGISAANPYFPLSTVRSSPAFSYKSSNTDSFLARRSSSYQFSFSTDYLGFFSCFFVRSSLFRCNQYLVQSAEVFVVIICRHGFCFRLLHLIDGISISFP